MKSLKKVVVISTIGLGLLSTSLIALDEAKVISEVSEQTEKKESVSKAPDCNFKDRAERRKMNQENCENHRQGMPKNPEMADGCGQGFEERPERRPMNQGNCGNQRQGMMKNPEMNGDLPPLPPQEMSRHKRKPDPMFMIVKELELSNEQREQFRKIMDDSKEFRGAMRKTREVKPKLSDYLTEKSFDKEKFAKDVLEFETAKIQGRTAHKLDNLEKVFNILTPEQRKKGIELMKKFEDERAKNFSEKPKERRF